MPEWVAPVVGLIGVVLGAGISEFRHWREDKEQYRVMTFEKRLQTYQEALSLCYELQDILNIAKSNEEKYEVIDKLQKWWENNCLSLDENTRQSINALTSEAYGHVSGYAEKRSTVFVKLVETRATIVQGIGIRHLPERPKKKEDEM
jgi:hypothetical protein